MFDYETIRLIWWVFIGIVGIAFALTEGFDFGVGTLLPFIGKSDVERRVIINTVGATWEGNQVWLVLLGGAIFAIWPAVYATLFSGLYAAMLLVLFSLFFRPAAFDYRSKIEDPRWRTSWDWSLFIGSSLPPILLGVLVGNLLLGLPFHFDQDLRSFYDGSFWALLSPFALLCGFTGLLLTTFHGALFLKWRSEGVIHDRAINTVNALGPMLLFALTAITIWVFVGIDRPEITQMAATDAPSNPLHKTVVARGASWLTHFMSYPWMWLAPLTAFVGIALAWRLGQGESRMGAFVLSSLGIAGVALTVGFGLFPFLLISSTAPGSSLTLWDGTSSHNTLLLGFWITIIFLPIVLLYTRFVYRVMWGSVTEAAVLKDSHTLY
ncbi:cytochrome d ubiquinol oxidase subunit II [Methylomonas fluvii]|uniref:Cytochrome d ubiquinol oxidase subunit II n=1 Tax=Methylomonas fluvii TaxID=1854564 RepID=A0ABR9DKJ3_9GAMM|nr:cytochrome d ubiquinol oxidase subunit II [Methylomonas fluvii]MBD9362858.1 cytochrome d ubiquinol oxidase subunit II [Methylomonas fluvii]CAD6876023.1 Cytochrome d ubiquinol oxidase subunit II (EC 1.10.3.-) [Methylomonas fluvii]